MADSDTPPEPPEIPEAVPAGRLSRTLQLVWIIPLVAAVVGGWLAIKAILEHGPTVTISFQSAEGLEAGKSRIKFKEVDIGVVKSITLSADRKSVIATAELVKDIEPMLGDDTRFWVVRPRISGGTVSGLTTLLSGSYIGVDFGKSNKRRREFVGLETPPVITIDAPGRAFTLRSDTIGSLDVGSPIYYRRLQVGQVTGYTLDEAGKNVIIKIFINAPYDRFVTSNTRFWHASGFDLSVAPGGVKLETQ
jgi:paraquat-inducible protein B